jgi:hypothetical protein
MSVEEIVRADGFFCRKNHQHAQFLPHSLYYVNSKSILQRVYKMTHLA